MKNNEYMLQDLYQFLSTMHHFCLRRSTVLVFCPITSSCLTCAVYLIAQVCSSAASVCVSTAASPCILAPSHTDVLLEPDTPLLLVIEQELPGRGMETGGCR